MLYMDVGGQEDDERYRYFPEGKHSEYHWSQRVPIFLKMFYGGK